MDAFGVVVEHDEEFSSDICADAEGFDQSWRDSVGQGGEEVIVSRISLLR